MTYFKVYVASQLAGRPEKKKYVDIQSTVIGKTNCETDQTIQ